MDYISNYHFYVDYVKDLDLVKYHMSQPNLGFATKARACEGVGQK
jgi:hypothetical protein